MSGVYTCVMCETEVDAIYRSCPRKDRRLSGFDVECYGGYDGPYRECDSLEAKTRHMNNCVYCFAAYVRAGRHLMVDNLLLEQNNLED